MNEREERKRQSTNRTGKRNHSVSLWFVLALTIELLSGCSPMSAKGPSYRDVQVPETKSDKALVFLYRVGAYTRIRHGSVKISVDGKKLMSLSDQVFTTTYLDPGPHEFVGEWSFLEKPLFEEGNFEPKLLSVSMEAGKTYYINYRIAEDDKSTTLMETQGLLGKALSKSHVIFVGLVLEDESVSQSNLRVCRFLPADF